MGICAGKTTRPSVGRGSLYVACLAVLLLGGVILSPPTARADPYHLQVENAVLSDATAVTKNNWIAQSFVPSVPFIVTQVSLYIEDVGGTGPLNVTLRPDSGGNPSGAILSGSVVNGSSVPDWVDFELVPRVQLASNQTYWIVAHPEVKTGAGYAWWNSGDDSAYPPGTGVSSSNEGDTWAPLDMDFAFRVYGYPQPSWAFAVNASTDTAMQGDPVAFQVNFTNLGPGSAAGLWLNVTLPPELAYVGDDAASVGGVRTGAHNYTFSDVAPGAYSFNLTTSVEGGVTNGTVVSAEFAFEGSDHLGVPLLQETHTESLTFLTDVSYSFDAQASNTAPVPGEEVVFGLSFTQLGPKTSEGLWVNATLPPELVYVGDDAASAGGVRTGAYNYTFGSLEPAAYAFNVTASVIGGVPNGTLASAVFRFTGRDSLGVPLPAETLEVALTVRNAVVQLALNLSAASVDPGDAIVLTASIQNSGGTRAQNLLVRGLVDTNLTFQSADPAATYDAGTRTVEWALAGLDPQAQTVLEWTGRVNVGTPDLSSLTFPVRVESEDLNATALPSVEGSMQAGVRVPVVVPALQLDQGSAGRGDIVTATLHYNNTGTGTAGQAWANWTLGDAFSLAGLSPPLPVTGLAQGFSVHLTNVTPGAHALQAQLEVRRGMEDGLALTLSVDWAAHDRNGNALPPAALDADVRLDAPSVGLVLGTEVDRVDSGALFAVNVTLRNGGRASAVGTLELALPVGISYVGDNGMLAVTAAPDGVAWDIPDLGAEETLALRIQLRATGDPGIRTFRFAFNYSDGRGSPAVGIMSNAVAVEVVSSAVVNVVLPWWWWLPLLSAALLPGYLLVRRWRRIPPRIHEVFVIDRGGLVLAHASDTLASEKDEDLVAAAFTAVQEFVRYHFSQSPDERVKTLEFGQQKILLEQGRMHYVAVVFTGEATPSLRGRTRALAEEIDQSYGYILSDWQGDSETIHGIRRLLPRLFED